MMGYSIWKLSAYNDSYSYYKKADVEFLHDDLHVYQK